MSKILYCVIHTKNQADRYQNIIQTWGKDVLADLLFYSDHENLEEKTIQVSHRSDYSSGEEKQINIVNILADNDLYSNYDWYFFCDNDTFVNTKNLLQLSGACATDTVHGLVATSWPKDPSLQYCGGGAGILVSNNILKKLYNNVYTHDTGYGDVALGICLRNLGIALQHHNSFHSFPPTHYHYTLTDITKQTTFHYIKDFFAMKALYENR